ncbi:helix-turn-helix domain-containing protein [bacterium]|nr:helix-turn-helix domain-containing protein [bacterium]
MRKYTKIYHDARVANKLDMLSYCILDVVYRLQDSKHSMYKGWCYISQEELASDFGCTSKTVANKIKKLILNGWLEAKNERSSFLKRTTNKYTQEIISYQWEKSSYNEQEKSSYSDRKKVPMQSEKSSYTDRKEVPIEQEKSSYNIENINKNINNSKKTEEADSLLKELEQLKKENKKLKAKKQSNQYTPALTLVTAKKEIDRLYATNSLHELFCSSVKPVDKKIVKLAKESFILKYSFDRYPIFNQDELQTALFKWIANQRPEYKTQTQTQTNKITAATQMTNAECEEANRENGFDF